MKSSSLSVLLSMSLILSGCCTLQESGSKANTAKLEAAHLAFIAKYTAPSSPAALPSDFESAVAANLKSYDDAIAGSKGCAEQQSVFTHEKNLFQNDANFVRTQVPKTKKGFSKKAGALHQDFLRGVYEGRAPVGATPPPRQ